jgi:hypothetical protein
MFEVTASSRHSKRELDLITYKLLLFVKRLLNIGQIKLGLLSLSVGRSRGTL